ncbi:hypothetical protein LWC34_31745 [Kibdelosporangium philippinense]|uniref:Putative T7SS secretion signal domain-containing protein n=1 Tax=Kibdelosporangium philippinense TaxID=211113 RepID=A0ABS8ZHS2_9PSEU|nr:hypothetical protein [Kibdelosporangium philippinense]MCE7007356.1 hypothetical protein [Kibdelosporangium philippinense]
MAELGQTGDPRQLVPGDPSAIEENVVAIRGRGQAMDNAGHGLKKIDNGAWQGAAGDAFRDQFSYEPGRWFQATDAFTATATALSSYAETLRWAQGQAGDAIRLWDEGERATQQAKQAHEQAAAEADARTKAGTPTTVAPFSDPGEAKRQAARETLNRARQQLTEAGDRAAAVIKGEGDKAPEESGWDAFWGGVGDVAGFVGDIGVGLWDGLAGTAEFLWELSPHHLIDNPDHYGEMWDGLTSAAAFAVDNPLEFGKQMVNWDQWSKEPGRALGNTAFGFIPVAGVVAKLRKLRKLSKLDTNVPDVKPNLHDYFDGGATPKASDLDKWAQAQGWTKTQTENGPPKYVDDNGVVRVTIKQGSPRAPGSGHPHVEIRDENGQRTDPFGNPVTRRDPGNHTEIDWDW